VKIVEKKAKTREQKADSAHHRDGQQDAGSRKRYMEQRRDSLVARLRAGNRAAAAELVDMYYEQIYLFMRRLGHSFQVSEDLTQESFLQAWQNIGQLRDGRALNSWIYRIASNISKLHWRRHRRREIAGIDGIDVPDGEAGSEKSERNEQLAELKSAVGQLPIKLRQAVVLHYMQHLTIAEAAEAVGINEGTFKSRLHRALKALKKQVI
jgi:RNA polymerase sigma factor (sigma-70 family)